MNCENCGHVEAMHDRMKNYHRRCKSFGCGCDDFVPEKNPREKGDDDGLEYGDPRDHRDGLE